MQHGERSGDDPAAYARDFGGIKVSAIEEPRLLRLIRDRLVHRSRLDITFLNPDYARRAFLDAGLRDRIARFDLVLVDGHGVRLLAPLFGFRIPVRLDTDSIAPKVFALLNELESNVFLFGSRPGVSEQAARRLTAHFPRIVVVGTDHGFHDAVRGHPGWFEAEDSDRIVSAMNRSGADFVLVSLPTPLQQNWLAEHRAAIEATIVMTSGSYVDHMADASWPRSWYPEWTTTMRLNWLYRLVKEPRRLWKRYSIEFIAYLWLAARARVSMLTDGNAMGLRRRSTGPRRRSS
jgi:N-acetylglucosaminyldiphosphoundecaprenol N-acetyl-beta-D-mannosaminyltransferase